MHLQCMQADHRRYEKVFGTAASLTGAERGAAESALGSLEADLASLDLSSKPVVPFPSQCIRAIIDQEAEVQRDILHIRIECLQYSASMIPPRHLAFILQPTSGHEASQSELDVTDELDDPPLALQPGHPSNASFLAWQKGLLGLLSHLEDIRPSMVLSEQYDEVKHTLLEQISRLRRWKEAAWLRLASGSSGVEPDPGREHFTQFPNPLEMPKVISLFDPLAQCHPLVLPGLLMAILLNLCFSVSTRGCRVFLGFLRATVKIASRFSNGTIDESIARQIPLTLQTVLNRFELDPVMKMYICCPQCFALKPHSSDETFQQQITCTALAAPSAQPCGAKLLMKRNFRIEVFLPLWQRGFWFPKTATQTCGVLVLGALVLLICSSVAAREIAGFNVINCTYFCIYCHLPTHLWECRSLDEHRELAQLWRDAPEDDREELINISGDGDGSFTSKSVPPRPNEDDLEAGRILLNQGAWAKLQNCSRGVLFWICADLDLRRAGKKADLMRELKRWRSEQSHGQNLWLYDFEVTPQLKAAVRVAETHFASHQFSKKSLEKRRHDVLQYMSALRSLGYTDKPKKVEMVEKLGAWRERQLASGTPLHAWDPESLAVPHSETTVPATTPISTVAPSTPDPGAAAPRSNAPPKRKSPGAVLGREVLTAVAVDHGNMQLPAWVTPAPSKAGHVSFGKLSADQWKTFCTVNLPVTLIRLWGFSSDYPRFERMLENFLDLVGAINAATMRVTSPDIIENYRNQMQHYLEGMKELYPEATIVPNHHTALHLPEALEELGPAPEWIACAMERVNFDLGKVSTNNRFGELELTMARSFCRAANLASLLREPGISAAIGDMAEHYTTFISRDQQGTRVQPVLEDHTQDSVAPAAFRLADNLITLLVALLNSEGGNYVAYGRAQILATGQGNTPVHSTATRCSKLTMNGVTYKPFKRSPGSSNVICRRCGADGGRPARILSIFKHSRVLPQGSVVEESFVEISYLIPLPEEVSSYNPYQRFPETGGSLWSSTWDSNPILVRPSSIMCHFARTELNLATVGPCLHVMPLDRLKTHLEISSSSLPMDTEDGAE
ncbi:hypothetical protein BKA70DRAFT_1229248 [Coprinopsis sp. MPI-PUGE-AT-0042]|nr:hypothetical protein BKA70DRAFT_1229248 [Coprinopsis sp. MPI-PUGE-AT-0042]